MKKKAALLAVLCVCLGRADQLYNNGPLITHIGQGFGGANVSAIQTSLGSGMAGYGVQLSGNNRLCDDFTVPAAGWHIDTITLYTYQQNSGTVSTTNDVRLQIWDGRPDESGSHVIFGNLTTNRLLSTSFTNIYRAPETNLTANNRPIMADVATIGANLPAGTYWLDWSVDGTLSTGPIAPPVTRQGQPGTGNAWQFNGNTMTWLQAVDIAGPWQDDFPFILTGTSSGGTTTVIPTSMTLSPGIVISGGIAQLAASDDQRLVLRPGVVLSSSQRPISLVLEAAGPASSASDLKFVIESHANQANLNQRVEVFNFVNGTYDPVLDSRNLTTTDMSVQLTIANPNSHIGAGNLLRTRVSYAAAGPVLSYPWQIRIDEATWRFTP